MEIYMDGNGLFSPCSTLHRQALYRILEVVFPGIRHPKYNNADGGFLYSAAWDPGSLIGAYPWKLLEIFLQSLVFSYFSSSLCDQKEPMYYRSDTFIG